MLLTYLKTLKEKGHFTTEEIARSSGIPEATIKNIISGKTEDPRFETVSAIIKAMNGSLDAIYDTAQNEKVNAGTDVTIKELYEHRLKEQNEHYEKRISELKEHISALKEHYESRLKDKNEHINTIMLDKRWFRIAAVVGVIAVFALFVVIEALTPGHGWFRY